MTCINIVEISTIIIGCANSHDLIFERRKSMDSKMLSRLILLYFCSFLSFIGITTQSAFAQSVSAFAQSVKAETYIDSLIHKPTTNLSSLTNNLFNDSLDLSTGTLSFYTIDVALKGNNHLPVQVGRRYGDGELRYQTLRANIDSLDAPVLSGVAYCDQIIPSPYEDHMADGWKANGLSLSVPNQPKRRGIANNGQHNLHMNGATAFTKDNWQFECLSPSNYLDFLVHAPNGDKYYFDVESGNYSSLDPYGYPWIQEVGQGKLYASKIEDKNGNWVKYEYVKDAQNYVTGISRIHSNDGREILLSNTIVSGELRVETVTANSRVWTYEYASASRPGYISWPYLQKVTQPDGKTREYSYTFVLGQRAGYPNFSRLSQMTIKHPFGTEITYDFIDLINGIYRLSCPSPQQDNEPKFFSNALSQKSLKVGAATHVWNFQYEQDNGTCNGSGISKTKWRETLGPDGTKQKEYFNREYDSFIKGRSEKREIFNSSGTLLNRSVYEFTPSLYYGSSGGGGPTSALEAYMTKALVEQDGDIFTTEYTYDLNPLSSDYSWGNPVQVKKYSNVSTAPLITDTEYKHDTNLWILGLPEKVTINGREEMRYEYDALGQLEKQFKYGALSAKLGYNTDGTTAWFEDASQRRTSLMLWKRGTAQHVQRPDNVIIQQLVDDNGWVTSTKNANGYTTSFVRDNDSGRVEEIHPPIQSPTYINYDFTGINPTQTIMRGPRVQTTTYDSMLRPTEINLGNEIYTQFSYDAAGHKSFESLPSNNSGINPGITYNYDGLGRIKTVVNDAGTTTHDYLSGHHYRVTGPTGLIKDSFFRGYQGPNNKDYILIKEYSTSEIQGRTTEINKNIWGEIESVRQHGNLNSHTVDQIQHFEYDAQRRLCRRSTPEGGHTLYRYDASGLVLDFSHELGMGTGCGTMTAVNRATNYYDINGRLFYTDYWSNVTEDTVKFYDANSNVTKLMRGLGSGAVGSNRTVWNYTYNEVDQIKTESLEIDTEVYDLSYVYDGHGRLTKRTLPGGSFVDIAPDALGRDNSVTYTYLDPNNQTLTPHALSSNMLYHPNGNTASLNYGNGHVYASTLNALQQVQHTITSNGTDIAFGRHYTYDAQGMITDIVSDVDSTYNMEFVYDSLGQLKTAHGYWGEAAYDYDSLGNIRSKTIQNWNGTSSTRTVSMSYDNTNNRLTNYTDSHGPNKTLSYDFRGNVTALGGQGFYYGLTNQPTALSGTKSGSYTYDGNLKRVRSEIAGVKIFNVYDASGTLVHIDDKGTGTKTDYVKGAGMTLARIKNGVPNYLHPDHLGSAYSATDSTGTVLWREYYTPFGETKNNPASNDNQAGFTGHIKDAATDLNYMQARYYDPVMGRFLSVDPKDFAGTGHTGMFNRYTYTFNDPINMLDPDGEFGVPGAVIGAVVGGVISGTVSAASEYRRQKRAGGEISIGAIAAKAAISGAAGAVTGAFVGSGAGLGAMAVGANSMALATAGNSVVEKTLGNNPSAMDNLPTDMTTSAISGAIIVPGIPGASGGAADDVISSVMSTTLDEGLDVAINQIPNVATEVAGAFADLTNVPSQIENQNTAAKCLRAAEDISGC